MYKYHYLHKTRPDVLVIGMWPLTIVGLLAYRLAGISGCVIVSDHTHLSSSPVAGSWIKRVLIKLTMGFFYPLADARLAVS